MQKLFLVPTRNLMDLVRKENGKEVKSRYNETRINRKEFMKYEKISLLYK